MSVAQTVPAPTGLLARRFGPVGSLALALVFLAVLPLVLPYTSLAGTVLVMGLFAAGYNLVFGYAGILSLGHAAMFGGGAYTTGLLMLKLGLSWPLAVVAGAVAGALVGIVFAALALRTRGIYFAMVTLALGQCGYQLAITFADVTGGDNGLRGFVAAPIEIGGLVLDPAQPMVRYYLMFGFAAVALAGLARVLVSPFGMVLRAMRENLPRARACGLDVRGAKALALALSGLVCGLAGSLYAIHLSTVPVDTLGYHLSGQAVMMTLLGGMGTFFGPLLGAALFVGAEHLVSDVTEYWQTVVGILFIGFVLFCPKGVWGTFEGARQP
ncbi:branched-chain amino acid ABC transporter permease [Rhodoplanes serenus]|jgi:branched-chain amino acid transport system permease protein|uniref:Branched-chain amino acid ABC transporter permease n=1 Tax=Rhodoplanes serenus TaxID=200615 RepID=A0A327KDP7_9BRAD|nr:branched-chain amino acid ABC transporter permease [Rhodoplanes serenus]MTW18728.1 branched-chain amino acid ABC transporter permease [Rhodoplanes serenus]RAI36457.1 branched-chain amino acid ABC transporter permease [Rhodoplanes serenus]